MNNITKASIGKVRKALKIQQLTASIFQVITLSILYSCDETLLTHLFIMTQINFYIIYSQIISPSTLYLYLYFVFYIHFLLVYFLYFIKKYIH